MSSAETGTIASAAELTSSATPRELRRSSASSLRAPDGAAPDKRERGGRPCRDAMANARLSSAVAEAGAGIVEDWEDDT